MPLCPGVHAQAELIPAFVCVGNFDERTLSSSSLTGGTQQSGPSKISLEATFGAARHTHVAWFGWKCPNYWD